VGLTFADVEINGVKFRALVDTGFNGDVLVSRSVAEKLKLPVIGGAERRTVDNRVIKVKVSYGRIRLFDSEGYSIIEIVVGYVVDPATGTLRKVGPIAV